MVSLLPSVEPTALVVTAELVAPAPAAAALEVVSCGLIASLAATLGELVAAGIPGLVAPPKEVASLEAEGEELARAEGSGLPTISKLVSVTVTVFPVTAPPEAETIPPSKVKL